jgi:SET domain-containing protein
MKEDKEHLYFVKNLIEVKESTIKDAGLGVFALRDIQKNELLAEYIGKEISIEEYKRMKGETEEYDNLKYLKKYLHKNYQPPNVDYIWEILDEDDNPVCYIDSHNLKDANWTRYVNCNLDGKNNVKPIQKQYQMFYYASEDIKKGEELFIDYGEEYMNYLKNKEKAPFGTDLVAGETKL